MKQRIIFVQRRTRTTVRSCATSRGHTSVEVFLTTTTAHYAPYQRKRGERRVAAKVLPEATRLMALDVLERRFY